MKTNNGEVTAYRIRPNSICISVRSGRNNFQDYIFYILTDGEFVQLKNELNAISLPEQEENSTDVKRLEVIVDKLDDAAISKEIAHRERCAKSMGVEIDDVLPDGDSNQLGKIFAECCRSLVEYRELSDSPETTASQK